MRGQPEWRRCAWSGRADVSTPWPWFSGRTAEVVVTPGNPGIAGRTAEGHTITCTATAPEEIEADLFVIGPEAPLVDGLADRLRGRRPPGVRSRSRRCPARGVQGVHEGDAGRGWCALCPFRCVQRPGCGQGVSAHPARTMGDQDRRPGRRQGRAGHRLAVRGRGRHRCQALRRRLRGGRSAGGDRGGTDRPRVLPAGAVRRRADGPVGPGPGLQAALRPRRRAQHRGHGGLLPGAVRATGRWSIGWSTKRCHRWWPRCGPGASTTGACSMPD